MIHDIKWMMEMATEWPISASQLISGWNGHGKESDRPPERPEH